MSGGPIVLLVEDHAQSRAGLCLVLEQQGYQVLAAAGGREALRLARRQRVDALVLDIKLPDMDGLAVLDAVVERVPGIPAIVITAYGTMESAVEAMKRGATDYLPKPIDVDGLLAILDRALRQARNLGSVPTPRTQASAEMERLDIIGYSRAMLELFDMIKRIAPHQSTVLILGESGTGKELVARALHSLGPRREGPFVPVNCATLSADILESEIFGHEKGSFTSADQAKTGVMEMADRGTLFLDEVNEMGLTCQAKLLRALERREFRRVGGTRKIKVNLNLIAASNAEMERLVTAGRFRSDLYYRLKVVTVAVPPLRERKEAIPALAGRFLEKVASQIGVPPRRLTREAMAQLVRYPWPGNIRELKNCIESLTLTARRVVVDVSDLPENLRSGPKSEIRLPIGTSMEDAEREIIRCTLETSPTIKEAARTLGIGLRTLHTKIVKYGLRPVPSHGSAPW